MARLLSADVCQLFGLEPDRETLSLLASIPDELPAPLTTSAAELTMAALDGHRAHAGRPPRSPWPSVDVGDLLVVPLAAGEPVGLLCAASACEQSFGDEDAELARAVAHLGAVAIKRAELIEGLTKANTIKDLFEALAAGATSFAATKAAEVRCDLTAAYLLVCAEPAGALDQASGGGGPPPRSWGASCRSWPRGRRSRRVRGRSARCCRWAQPATSAQTFCCTAVASSASATAPRSGSASGGARPADAAAAYREASDAATIARALLGDGGAIDYSRVGAYRYLVHIGADDAPRDRMRAAVDRLIAYDSKRRTALLDTLERYLSERRSVIESARALYIHPNTLRQRLGRIEELTGLDLDVDDLLSLELAIKLARLHGRPDAD